MSETEANLTLRDADAVDHIIKKTDIAGREKQKISLMPADLQKAMTDQDLLDVVEYLRTLRDE